jgi:hypothetical protein
VVRIPAEQQGWLFLFHPRNRGCRSAEAFHCCNYDFRQRVRRVADGHFGAPTYNAALFRLEEQVPKTMPSDTWHNLFYPPPDYKYFENSAELISS